MTPTDPTSSGSSTHRRIIVIVLAALLAVAIAVTLFFVSSGAGSTPDASPSSTSPATEFESASPTSAQPEATAIDLPAHCEDAFSPQYFALRTQYPFNPLNHETVADSWILPMEELEALRTGLPHLRCTWAAAGEEGILGSINDVTPAEAGGVLLQLKEEGYDCIAHRQGTTCSIGLAINEENGATVSGEEHFLRDNIWISTWWLNIDIAGYNDDIIDVLWDDAQH
jgi:hypothetical protein